MKRILSFITHRLFIIITFLLIQILFLIIILLKFKDSFYLFYFITQIIGFMLLLRIINSKLNPSYKIAWIIPILIIPIFGTLSYLVLANKYSNRLNKKLKRINDKLENHLKQHEQTIEEVKKDNLDAYNQMNYLINIAKYPVYKNTEIKYLNDGTEYYKKLIEELKKAEKYIFLEYFIIREGKLWNDVLDVLKQKVSNGVDVRIIYDDIGCILTLPNKYYKKLEGYGIKCCSFNKFVPVFNARLNNRDHRKIAVIDGKVGFTGGINLADEYINEKQRFGYWKDNGVMLKGDAVYSLTVMFLTIWDHINNIEDDYDNYKVKSNEISNGYIQPYNDTPLDSENVGETVYLNLINKAKKYIYITSPYLVIDSELETALKVASKNGIDVKIFLPGIADKKSVNEVTKAYYANLLESGVKIYEYENGFIHSKTFLVDDIYATVGSINLDYRSLYLHFECGVFMYKTECIKDIKSDFEELLKNSKEIKISDTKISLFRNLKRAILRLLAPLM